MSKKVKLRTIKRKETQNESERHLSYIQDASPLPRVAASQSKHRPRGASTHRSLWLHPLQSPRPVALKLAPWAFPWHRFLDVVTKL